jgi:hypothetical protein
VRTGLGVSWWLILSQRVDSPLEYIPFRISIGAVFFSSPTLRFVLTTIIIPIVSLVNVVRVGSIVSSGMAVWRAFTRTFGFTVVVEGSRRTATATLIRFISIILVIIRASLKGIIRRLLEVRELRRKVHGPFAAPAVTNITNA